uniref:Variant surface glycoprotein 1106 n=1 Tax=Trypanosoma brucei TaxID=5691 RepID=M4SXM9_9TRYP|nr:variant surface glycoprotein 1106 [Trypanosoma brucei]
MTHNPKLHWPAVFVLLVLGPRATQAAAPSIKLSTYKPVCSLAADLRKIPRLAYTAVDSKQAEATQSRLTALKTMIYSITSAPATAKLNLQALALATLKLATTAETDQANRLKEGLNAAGTCLEMVGRIEGTMEILKATHHSGAGCLGGDADNQEKNSELATLGCEGKPTDVEATSEAITDAHIGAAGYASLTAVAGASGVNGDSNKCGLINIAGAGTGAIQTGSTPTILNGIFKFSAANQFERQAKTAITKPAARATADILSQAHADARNIIETSKAGHNEDPISILKTTVNKGYLKQELEAQIALIRPDVDAGAKSAETQTIVDKNFKTNDDTIKNLWDKIKAAEVADVTAKVGSKKQLQNIADEKTLQATLAYYGNKNTVRIAELEADLRKLRENSAKKNQQPPEKVCNAIGDKNETGCKNTSGCHFVSTNPDGTKCTLITGETAKDAEAGKDGKPEDKCAKQGTEKNACDKDSNCK